MIAVICLFAGFILWLLHRSPVHGRPSGRSHAAGRALT